MTTAALSAIKKSHPGALVDYLVEPPAHQLLVDNPDINFLHVYAARGLLESLAWIVRIRRIRYDWVIDYMGNGRSALITAASRAPVRAGLAHVGHRWAYNHRLVQSSATQYAGLEKILLLKGLGVSEADSFLPASGVSGAGGAPGERPPPLRTGSGLPRVHVAGLSEAAENVVGLAPASRRITRQWPAASYIRLGRLLREAYDCRILVFWGPGERELAEEVSSGIGAGAEAIRETKDLRDAARLMSRCRLVIANCNGPKHLAVALGVPTVTIHGSSDPKSWNPPGSRHLVVRREDLSCIGCGLNRCPYGLECLTELPAERVFEAARRLL